MVANLRVVIPGCRLDINSVPAVVGCLVVQSATHTMVWPGALILEVLERHNGSVMCPDR